MAQNDVTVYGTAYMVLAFVLICLVFVFIVLFARIIIFDHFVIPAKSIHRTKYFVHNYATIVFDDTAIIDNDIVKCEQEIKTKK